jgi:hypothetical protein
MNTIHKNAKRIRNENGEKNLDISCGIDNNFNNLLTTDLMEAVK